VSANGAVLLVAATVLALMHKLKNVMESKLAHLKKVITHPCLIQKKSFKPLVNNESICDSTKYAYS